MFRKMMWCEVFVFALLEKFNLLQLYTGNLLYLVGIIVSKSISFALMFGSVFFSVTFICTIFTHTLSLSVSLSLTHTQYEITKNMFYCDINLNFPQCCYSKKTTPCRFIFYELFFSCALIILSC